jgi:hypothetical protein
MLNVPEHLLVNISADQAELLLGDWRWLIGDDKNALLITASGDAFLADPHGNVLWLETGGGELVQVAGSIEDFQTALTDETNQREWLFAPVVAALRMSGKILEPGECYGFRMPAVLGGAYDGDNRVAISAREHFGFTGYLHRQIKDLPDGTQIKLKWTD